MLPAIQQGLTALAVTTVFTCSSMLLTHLGYHYDSPGGNFLQKFHPSSFLLAAGFALFAVLRQLSATQHPSIPSLTTIAIYLYLTVSYACYIAVALGRPATFVIDSLIAPFIALILVCSAGVRTKLTIAFTIHVAMAANALIGMAESQTGWRLIPFYLDSLPIDYDWRATALFGHPLQNALISSMYAMLLVTGQHFGIGRATAAVALAVQIVALPSFGGRAATVGLSVIILLVLAVRALLILAGKRFTRTSLALGCAVAVLAFTVGLVAVETGYIGKFIGRFAEDDGSAQTRISMFQSLRCAWLGRPVLWTELRNPKSSANQRRCFYRN